MKKVNAGNKIFIGLIMLVLFFGISYGDDWLCWRGANGDGISQEKGWNPKALNNNFKTLWQYNLGMGFSSFSVKGNLLYSMGSIDKDGTQWDVVTCLNTKTGKLVWSSEYKCKKGPWAGTRSTPTIDGAYVYTISRLGNIFCFDRKNGKIIWQKDIIKEKMAIDPDFGIAGSPLIYKNMVIYNAGGAGLAVNKKTGKVIWHSGPAKCGFASPVVYNIDGEDRIAMLSRKAFHSLDPLTGKIFWSMDWLTKYEENIPDPIIKDNKLFLCTAYGRDCALFKLTKKKPELIWKSKVMSNHFYTSILVDGYLYGLHGESGKRCLLRCVEFNTGKLMWEQKAGFGPIMVVNDNLFVLSDKGKLTIAKVNPKKYIEITSAEIFKHKTDASVPNQKRARCWTPPVLANGQLYVRAYHGQLKCIDMK